MFKVIVILLGIMIISLVGMALLIVEECIRDYIRYRKRRNITENGSCHSISSDDTSTHHKANVNNVHHAWDDHATAARMAQEVHDTAVRDSRLLHEDACRMTQESHDTAMLDHQAAVDLHDHVVSDPGFGCCGPFF